MTYNDQQRAAQRDIEESLAAAISHLATVRLALPGAGLPAAVCTQIDEQAERARTAAKAAREASMTTGTAYWPPVPEGTDRPATTDQQPMVYGAAQPARLVITETIAASRTQGDGPWTTAEAILGALDRAGYAVAPKVAFPHKGMSVTEASEWWERWIAAARAPEAPGDAQSPTPDVGAAQGGEGGSAAESEPRVHYEVEAYTDGWSFPIHRTDHLEDARAHEELPPGDAARTRIVRVTREVIT